MDFLLFVLSPFLSWKTNRLSYVHELGSYAFSWYLGYWIVHVRKCCLHKIIYTFVIMLECTRIKVVELTTTPS
jgi:hypothetical protein